MKVMVTMGWFDDSGACAIVEVDLDSERAESVLHFAPPADLRVPGKGFTGARWDRADANRMYVCGFNAVYGVDTSRWCVDGALHTPCMNDLHDVEVDGDRLLVVNTGLDSVEVFSRDGQYLGGYTAQPAWLAAKKLEGISPSRETWTQLLRPGWTAGAVEASPGTPVGSYYDRPGEREFHRRKVRDYVHPNHIAVVGDQVLVTRLRDSSVMDVTRQQVVIADTPGHPHDGQAVGPTFWVTCVDGIVVGYAIEEGRVTGRQTELIDVRQSGHFGWCRGLHVTDDVIVVGLTEVRRSPGHRWRGGERAATETSVLALDRASGAVMARVQLTDRERHSKVFGIVAGAS